MATELSPMSIDAVLAAAAEQVERAEDGGLLWSWRVRLADAFNRVYPRDSLWRQQVLSYLVAQETLPAFRRVADALPPRMRELPQRFLAGTRQTLGGDPIAKADLMRDVHREDDIEHAMSLYDVGTGVYAVLAAYSALPEVVARHEAQHEEFDYDRVWDSDYRLTEMDEEWSAWDTHYWASLVAGGCPGTAAFSAAAHRAFWLDWTRRTVPRVLGARSRLLRLVRTPA